MWISAYCGEGVVLVSQPVGSCSVILGKVQGCFVLVKNSSTWIWCHPISSNLRLRKSAVVPFRLKKIVF